MNSSQPTAAHRFQYLAYRGFEFILARLPLDGVFWAGEVLGRIFRRLSPRYQHLVAKNVRLAFPDRDLSARATLEKESFARTGANLLSSLKTAFLSDAALRDRVAVNGLESIESALKARQGVILLIPHMGNWELIAQAPSLLPDEVKGGTHYRPLSNPLINDLLEKRRRHRGIRLFPKQSSVHAMSTFLREGGLLGVLADVRAGPRGDLEPLLGRLGSCSPLPRLLAQRTQAPIVTLSCHTTGHARWALTFRAVSPATTRAAMDSLGAAYRRSPSDVFWFQDRWKLPAKRPLGIFMKYPQTPPAEKPIRVLDLTSGTRSLPSAVSRHLHLDRADLPRPPTLEWLRARDEDHPLPLDLLICDPKDHPGLRPLAKSLSINLATPDQLPHG